jgi:fructokinase
VSRGVHKPCPEAPKHRKGLVNAVGALSPERIVLGGGAMKAPTLLARVRERLRDLLTGYFDAPELREAIDDFVVRPGLGDRAGVLGAIALAREAVGG